MIMEKMSHSNHKYYRVNETTSLVRVNHPDDTYITGILDVKAVRGCVQIMGYKLTPKSRGVTMYSIKEFNTLKITSVEDDCDADQCTESYLLSLDLPQSLITEIVEKQPSFTHVYLVKQNNDAVDFISYLRSYSFPGFAKEITENSLTIPFRNGGNTFLESKEWNPVINKIMHKPKKVLICGGQNVGKSNLLRYMVNKSLEKWPEVLVLDFDPGQSEFTVMGCSSAVVVKQPLLGPNFSHLITPAICFYLGDISATGCSKLLVDSVRNIVASCLQKYEDIPWFINTMGFSKGLGIILLHNIINYVKPDKVVQINRNNVKYDFPEPVTPEFLQRFASEPCYGNYKLHVVSSVAGSASKDNYTAGGIEPITKRNLVTMSYFRSVFLNTKNTDLLGVVPQKIYMDKVEIIVRKPSSTDLQMTLTRFQKLCCINANIVALCSGGTDELNRCEGFGIIRGFDLDSEEIFILTPLSSAALERITVIQMSSSIHLPIVLHKNQVSHVHGSCPYMAYNKQPDKLSQPVRRTTSRLKHVSDPKSSLEYTSDG